MYEETVGSGNPELKSKENVLYGCLGALLMSLIGGAATVLLMQTNYIVGIAGWLSIVLAYWGYKKFTKQSYSRKGLWLSIIIAVLVQIGAFYLGVVIEIYRELEGTLTLGRIFALMPEFMEGEEFRDAVLGDIGKLLLFMALASVFTVVATFKQIKALEAQDAERRSVVYRDEDCDADQ